MRKSVKREYELDRSYDYAESYGFKNTKQNVGFVKKRSHRRLRQQLKAVSKSKLEESFDENCRT